MTKSLLKIALALLVIASLFSNASAKDKKSKSIIANPFQSNESYSSFKSSSAKKNAIKINPLSLALTCVNVQYQRALNEKSGFQIGGYYYSFSLGGSKYTQFAITPEYRYYFSSKESMNGWFVAPYLRYISASWDVDFSAGLSTTSTIKATATGIGGGALIGRQWTWDSGFTLEAFLGIGYYSYSAKADSEVAGFKLDASRYESSVAFDRLGLCLGYAF